MSDPRSESYRKRIYDQYISTLAPGIQPEVEDTVAFDRVMALDYMPWLPRDKKVRILDLGCGRGRFLSYLQRHGYENSFGLDRSPEVVRLAQQRGIKNVVCGDNNAYLVSHPNEFDCIATTDVLEHLQKHEILALLDDIHAALKPGGSVVIATLNADGLTYGRIRYGDFTHETAFTRYSLHQVLSAAGFEDIEFHAMEPRGQGLRFLPWRLLWRFIRLGIGVYYHLESGSGIIHNYHILTLGILARARKRTPA